MSIYEKELRAIHGDEFVDEEYFSIPAITPMEVFEREIADELMVEYKDAWKTLAEKDRAELNPIDQEYLTPMEDIYEEIEKLISDDSFGLYYNSKIDTLVCSDFYCYTIPEKPYNHSVTCRVKKLKDLIATLGDMSS